ncbi:MAG: hypothetical protein SYC29_17595 [Planctomycetota bacterium]|nr:hypothetical protein [Planctomycetota bacterium]
MLEGHGARGRSPLGHDRAILRRRLGPLAVLLVMLPAGCAASEKAAYVSHLRHSIHRTTTCDAQLAAAFGLDEPEGPVLAEADTSGGWNE